MKKQLKKKNGWKCKGFTLIETMGALVITMILLLLISKMTFSVGNQTKAVYKERLEKEKIENSIESLKINLTKSENEVFKKVGDSLIIGKTDGTESEIFLEGKVLYFRYKKESFNREKILENVEGFRVIKKGKLIYLNINMNGENMVICV